MIFDSFGTGLFLLKKEVLPIIWLECNVSKPCWTQGLSWFLSVFVEDYIITYKMNLRCWFQSTTMLIDGSKSNQYMQTIVTWNLLRSKYLSIHAFSPMKQDSGEFISILNKWQRNMVSTFKCMFLFILAYWK